MGNGGSVEYMKYVEKDFYNLGYCWGLICTTVAVGNLSSIPALVVCFVLQEAGGVLARSRIFS